jgi:pSer/pThr/pTyr-binding forkhead associated (FHA) protein
MTCTTCGRENPAHLTFCQECGQRLGPRIAPPTPPIGLGSHDAYAPAPSPPAPPPPLPRPKTELGVGARPAPGGDRRCKICDTPNAPNLRYCTSCGSTLDGPPLPATSGTVTAPPLQAPAPAPSPSPGLGSAGSLSPAQPPASVPTPHAIAPARVLELGTPVAAEGARTCTRCRGVADSGAQFCKFCGAPLEGPRANGASSAETVKPNRPATAPVSAYGAPPQPASYGAPPAPTKVEGPGAAATASPQPRPHADVGPGLSRPHADVGPGLSRPHADVGPGLSRPHADVGPQRGRLVVIAKSGADGPSYPFGDVIDVGRTEGHVVVGEDPYLSPRHVRILWNGGKLILRDLASTNGIFLRLAPSRDTAPRRANDSPEVAVPLHDQDMILVGQQVLRFDVLKEGEGGLGPAQEHGTLLFGSPAAPRYARLCQRTVEGIARDIYYVRKVETVLGRESGDVVFTEDPFLSRRHAAIRLLSREGATTDLRFSLVDLGSSNGTFLRIRGDVELAPGDHFRVGQQLFRVDFEHGARS